MLVAGSRHRARCFRVCPLSSPRVHPHREWRVLWGVRPCVWCSLDAESFFVFFFFFAMAPMLVAFGQDLVCFPVASAAGSAAIVVTVHQCLLLAYSFSSCCYFWALFQRLSIFLYFVQTVQVAPITIWIYEKGVNKCHWTQINISKKDTIQRRVIGHIK